MKFSFYRADALYCDYLRKSDPCVPYTMDQKEARPFIGIVLTLNDYDYYFSEAQTSAHEKSG